MIKCYGCEQPLRRGFPMITPEGEEVVICEKCHRLWKKHNTTNESTNEITPTERSE